MIRLPLYISSFLAVILLGLTARAEQPKFGVIAPMSGDFAHYGNRVRSGLVATGMPIARFVFEDEACQPKAALNGMRNYIANRSIRLFVGPYCGASQLAVAKVLQEKTSVAVLGTSASENLFKASNGRMFGVQPSIETESRFNAERMNGMGVKSVVVILFDGDFSRSYESAFKSAFKGKILDTIVLTSADLGAMRPSVTRIRNLKPDAVYIPGVYPLLRGFLKRMREVGLGCLPVFSVFSAQTSQIVAASDGNADQLVYSYPKIGEKDAIAHFSGVAAKTLQKAAAGCAKDSCVVDNLRSQNNFDEYGTLRGDLELRRFTKRGFVPFTDGAFKSWNAQVCETK